MNQPDNENNIEEAETQPIDFTKPDFVFLPKGNHSYKQQGYYLVCKSCEIQHATFIGPNKIMVGVKENGEPIIKTRKELNMA